MTSRAQRAGWALVAALLAVLFAPTLAWLIETWRAHPFYAHGLLSPLVAGALAWHARRRAQRASPQDAGAAVVALGLAVHLFALRQAAWPLSAAGLLIVLVGLALLTGGRDRVAAYGLPIAVLALAIPVPWVERLAPPLAATVAHAAAGAAGIAGVPAVVTGAQVAVGSHAFVVGAPCSGLRSLVVLVTIAVIVAGLSGLPVPRRAVIVASAVPLAMAANGLRVVTLICAAGAVASPIGLSRIHAVSGAALFAASVLGLVALAHVLGRRAPRGA